MTKKFVCIVFAFLLCASCTGVFAGCESSRDEILRVYVPGEYVDPEVYEDFAEWYKERTGGKNIEVKETTFDSNEAMLLKIEKSKKDYDLVCPSDYMIEHMIANGLLIELSEQTKAVTQSEIKDTYMQITNEFDRGCKYTVPYMYGTFGIMYDYEKTKKHIDSWEYMFFEDEKDEGKNFVKKFTQKESVREMYASACIYAARAELAALRAEIYRKSGGVSEYYYEEDGKRYEPYKERIQEVFKDSSVDAIKEAKRLLSAQKKYILKYEVDDGKFGIAGGTLSAAGGLYWSCDAGYVMGDYEDDEGNEYTGNKNLWYVIPKEGGNVYIDGLVIPKYAKNVTAAELFLEFLCTEETAIKNSEYAGAISPVEAAYDTLLDEYSTDESRYENTDEGWKEMYLDMLFPSEETLRRCGVMKDFTTNNSAINRMFADIVG